MSILRSIPNHVPLKHTCLIKKSNRSRHAYLVGNKELALEKQVSCLNRIYGIWLRYPRSCWMTWLIGTHVFQVPIKTSEAAPSVRLYLTVPSGMRGPQLIWVSHKEGVSTQRATHSLPRKCLPNKVSRLISVTHPKSTLNYLASNKLSFLCNLTLIETYLNPVGITIQHYTLKKDEPGSILWSKCPCGYINHSVHESVKWYMSAIRFPQEHIRLMVLNQHPEILHNNYILILRMWTTLTSCSSAGFGSSSNETFA